MATDNVIGLCIKCNIQKSVVKCEGCRQLFCFDDLSIHRQQLSKQLDGIEVNRQTFQHILNDQTNNPQNHSLIKQIDQWEKESINKIQQTANECRQVLLEHTSGYIDQMKINLIKLTDEIREIRKQNDFNESDIRQFQNKLTRLVKELDQPPNISIQQYSTPLVNKISVVISSQQLFDSSNINTNRTWKRFGITIAGGNGKGNQPNQFNKPIGISIDDDLQCIYIADCHNHRIVQWSYGATNGEIVVGRNGCGNGFDQLNQPMDVIVDKMNNSIIVADIGNRRIIRCSGENYQNQEILISNIDCSRLTMDHNGNLYVSNWKKDEIRRWKIGDQEGTLVAGGNGRGSNLNQFNIPTFIFVDQNYSVYVLDWCNHRIMKWLKGAKEGIIVAGGQGEGTSLEQLDRPQGFIVDHLNNIYVADCRNNRITRWSPGLSEGSIVVGGNGEGKQSNQLNKPTGLSFDREGNLYVVDGLNHRVQKFDINRI